MRAWTSYVAIKPAEVAYSSYGVADCAPLKLERTEK